MWETPKERPASPEEPALIELRRRARASPEEVGAAVERVFRGVTLRRRGRVLLYALRRYSCLRPIEIARRQARTPTAVTVATKTVAAEATRAPTLASALRRLEGNAPSQIGTLRVKTQSCVPPVHSRDPGRVISYGPDYSCHVCETIFL